MGLTKFKTTGRGFRWPNLSLGARLTLGMGLLIGLTSVALFVGIYRLQEQQALQHLNTQAYALLTEMIVLREWASSYGGVWTTRPGDYYLEARDDFYQKSPAMITKELSKLSNIKGFYRYHITSLRLMNPENAPDDFEHDTLLRFEQNAQPVTTVEKMNDQSVYRLMVPLKVEQSCLRCHSDQGYQVGDIRGGLSVLLPMSEMEQSLQESRRALILSAIAITAIVMSVLYLVVRRTVISPLAQLKALAVAVGQGNYEARSQLQTGDELEILGQTLNQTVSNLKLSTDALQEKVLQRTRELEALSDIALIISHAGVLEDVLQEALEKVLQVTGADGGAVYLAEEPERLRLAAHIGLSAPIIECLDASSCGREFAQWVLQRGEPIYITNLEHFTQRIRACHRDNCPAHLEGYGSLAGVSLSSRNRSLGTLMLLSRTGERFSPEAMQLLACIGRQLGVAVENAWFHTQTEYVAILEERHRIARELHDSLAQTLGWLNIKMELLAEDLNQNEVKQALSEMTAIRRVVRDACYDVRESIDGLRTQPADGLVAAAAAWISEFSKRSGLVTDFRAKDSEVRLSPVVETEVVRILQEALTNVRKHAQARQVKVDLQVKGAQVELMVEDDGVGFDYAASRQAGHFGLRIMRERVERLGGAFQIDTLPGQGTRLTAQAPIYPSHQLLAGKTCKR
ncbi:MAG: DUF3365 domain-containing protein [Chloroflexota bacterium]